MRAHAKSRLVKWALLLGSLTLGGWVLVDSAGRPRDGGGLPGPRARPAFPHGALPSLQGTRHLDWTDLCPADSPGALGDAARGSGSLALSLAVLGSGALTTRLSSTRGAGGPDPTRPKKRGKGSRPRPGQGRDRPRDLPPPQVRVLHRIFLDGVQAPPGTTLQGTETSLLAPHSLAGLCEAVAGGDSHGHDSPESATLSYTPGCLFGQVATPRASPARVPLSGLLFGMTTSAGRIFQISSYLKLWARAPARCVLVLHTSEFDRIPGIEIFFQREDISCRIRTSPISRPEERYLGLVKDLWEAAEEDRLWDGTQTVWFALGDDDTVWFKDNLLTAVSAFNGSSEDKYLGDNSDNDYQTRYFGNKHAYSGAGVVLSAHLMARLQPRFPLCLAKAPPALGGDGLVGACVASLGITLTRDFRFHQMDIRGDATGYMEGGLAGLVTLHLAPWLRIFPANHTTYQEDGIRLFGEAAATLGPRFLARHAWVDPPARRSLVLTSGYSVSLYSRALSRKDLAAVEYTWQPDEPLTRPTRPAEPGKRVFYLRSIQTTAVMDVQSAEPLEGAPSSQTGAPTKDTYTLSVFTYERVAAPGVRDQIQVLLRSPMPIRKP